MKDTSPEIESRFMDMMMSKSGVERLMMGFAMFETARRQVIASIKGERPDIDEKELRRQVFLRFYGQEFDENEREKIFKGLAWESKTIVYAASIPFLEVFFT